MGAESTKSSKHRFTASNAQLEEHSHRWESRNLLTMATWGWDSAEESFLEKNMYKMKKKRGSFARMKTKLLFILIFLSFYAMLPKMSC